MALDLNKIAKSMKAKISSKIEDPKDFVSTGNVALDLITDGGVPFGYVTEFMGFSQSGKSLFIQQIIGNAMNTFGAIGILIDRENAYTNKRGEQLGIDNDKLIVFKPKDVPTPFDAFSKIIQTVEAIRKEDKKVYIAIGIDSISAFGKDTALDKADVGRKAKAVHEGLRETLTILDQKVMLLVANQFTFKIGVLYGDPRTTTAGESMKYYGNLRLALQDRKQIVEKKRGNEVMGNWIGVEVIKTRLGPCFRECYLQHLYKTGIDPYSGYLRLLAKRGYIKAKNVQEFDAFKQTTVIFGEGDDKVQYHELSTEKFLQDHPELNFDHYPEYKGYEDE